MKKLLFPILFLLQSACFSQVAFYPAAYVRLTLNLTNAVIICDGNSLTYGDHASNQATTSYPAVLQTLVPFNTNGAVVTNKGVNGRTTPQMLANVTTGIDVLYNPAVTNIILVWEGTNDLANNTINGTTAYNNLVSYCTTERAKGFKIVIATIIYRDQTIITNPSGKSDSEFNTERLAANALIRANWTSFADGLMDLANEPGLMAYNPSDGFNYYYLDHVHLLDAGYARVAYLFKQKILTL